MTRTRSRMFTFAVFCYRNTKKVCKNSVHKSTKGKNRAPLLFCITIKYMDLLSEQDMDIYQTVNCLIIEI